MSAVIAHRKTAPARTLAGAITDVELSLLAQQESQGGLGGDVSETVSLLESLYEVWTENYFSHGDPVVYKLAWDDALSGLGLIRRSSVKSSLAQSQNDFATDMATMRRHVSAVRKLAAA